MAENRTQDDHAEIKRMIRKGHVQNMGWIAVMVALTLALTQVREYKLLARVPFVIGLLLFILACQDPVTKRWHRGITL